MAKTLDAATKQALNDRLRYYRDLGIYDFYTREVDAETLAALGISGKLEESSVTPDETMATLKKAKAPSAATLSIFNDRATALGNIRADLGDCTRCVLHQGRKQIVFGVGNVNADIMFIGEGPGADEDEQGEPFVGRCGQLLNNMISAMGIKREDVYIANVVKCRPPANRVPEREECDTCSPFLMRQIAILRPKVIVALGATSAKTLLLLNDSMANLRGKFYDFTPNLPPDAPEHALEIQSIKLVVTYHPAYLLRDPRQKKETWKDLQMVMAYLGMKPPAKTE